MQFNTRIKYPLHIITFFMVYTDKFLFKKMKNCAYYRYYKEFGIELLNIKNEGKRKKNFNFKIHSP